MAKHVERLLDVVLSADYRDLLDEYGKPVVPSNNIYIKISTALHSVMKPKYIYIIVKENRYGILDKIRKFHDIDILDSILLESTTSSLETSTRDKNLEFKLTFSNKDWISMSPEDILYFDKEKGCRNYCTLRRTVWTNKIYAAIYKATKLPCALVLKTSKISESGIYLSVKGLCKECNCSFLGQVVNKPPLQADVIMDCKISNFDETVRHKGKRQLKGQRRTKVSKVLAENHELPCRWRRAEANKLMDLGDPEPAHLPSNAVLRKAKQERQDINLGTNNATDPIKNIFKMKYELLAGSIHSISLDPFFVHYWTLEQIAVYMQYPNFIIGD